MTGQITAALPALLLFGCASVSASPVEVSQQPMDVRIVSAPKSKSDSEIGLTVATWALVLGTIDGFAYAARRQSADMRESMATAKQATEAGQCSADPATQAAQQAAKYRRETLIRETTLAIHRLVYTATSVRKLAETVPKAMAELLTLSGRGSAIGAGELPGSGAAVERTTEADAMAKNASSILASDWRSQSDDQIANTLVLMESHLEKLQVTKEEILRDLSQIETDKATVVRRSYMWLTASARGWFSTTKNPIPGTLLGGPDHDCQLFGSQYQAANGRCWPGQRRRRPATDMMLHNSITAH